MTTIYEAVTAAFSDWSSADTDVDDMEALAEEHAQSAVEEWKAERTQAAQSPVRDTSTINGAVLAAMDDWAASGHTVEEMEGLVVEFIQRAVADWSDQTSSDPLASPGM